MADDPHDPLNEVVDLVVDAAIIITDPKKAPRTIMSKAYAKTMLANATSGAVVAAMSLAAGEHRHSHNSNPSESRMNIKRVRVGVRSSAKKHRVCL